jgi:two-component sensor histidine kinase
MSDPTNILYIDDDDGLRRLTARALQRRGHAVTVAASGEEGVALAAETRFDLVAVDHHMPGMDGLETLAALNRLDPPPPVIYVTASDDGRLAVTALKAGAIDYVVKSAGDDYFDLLAEAVDQALATVALRTANTAMQAELRRSNARLQSLLHEASHRVANSLQLVSAMVSMQARLVTDEQARAALDMTCQRIGAIAGIHRRLYTSASVSAVDMAEYLGSLVADLTETLSTPAAPRSITLSAASLMLPSQQAVAFGVIVNELVTNACKYACPADAPGEIAVTLSAPEPGRFRLTVADHGPGLDPASPPRGSGLGSRLVEAMATTLQAQLHHADNHPGLVVTLEGPLPPLPED